MWWTEMEVEGGGSDVCYNILAFAWWDWSKARLHLRMHGLRNVVIYAAFK